MPHYDHPAGGRSTEEVNTPRTRKGQAAAASEAARVRAPPDPVLNTVIVLKNVF